MKNEINLIEVTDTQSESRITVNIASIDYLLDMGGRTLIVFGNHNISVRESYGEIKTALMQMV